MLVLARLLLLLLLLCGWLVGPVVPPFSRLQGDAEPSKKGIITESYGSSLCFFVSSLPESLPCGTPFTLHGMGFLLRCELVRGSLGWYQGVVWLGEFRHTIIHVCAKKQKKKGPFLPSTYAVARPEITDFVMVIKVLLYEQYVQVSGYILYTQFTLP